MANKIGASPTITLVRQHVYLVIILSIFEWSYVFPLFLFQHLSLLNYNSIYPQHGFSVLETDKWEITAS